MQTSQRISQITPITIEMLYKVSAKNKRNKYKDKLWRAEIIFIGFHVCWMCTGEKEKGVDIYFILSLSSWKYIFPKEKRKQNFPRLKSEWECSYNRLALTAQLMEC